MQVGFSRKRGTAAIVVSLAAVLMLVAAPNAFAKRHTRLFNGYTAKHAFQVKPAVVGFTGDGSAFAGGPSHNAPHDLGKIDWKKWGKHKAAGRATFWLNDCVPDCADGHFHGKRGSIRAANAKHHRYRTLKLSYRYHGHHYRPKYSLKRTGSSYYWG